MTRVNSRLPQTALAAGSGVGVGSGSAAPTVMTTIESSASSLPGSGSWRRTMPTLSLISSCSLTRKPSLRRVARASAVVSPTTSGTPSCPLETTRLTTVPGGTCSPAEGVWLMTCPAASDDDDWVTSA